MNRFLPVLQVLFGAAMGLAGANRLVGGWWPMPAAADPRAAQLLAALDDSGLAQVAFAIMLAGGTLILLRLAVPLALAALLSVNLGTLFWALWLEQDPVWAPLALLAVAVNGLLMLAHLEAYRAMLAPRALATGETGELRYEGLFSDPAGGIALQDFALGVLLLAAACAFYWFLVPMVLAWWNLVALGVPAAVLLAKGVQGLVGKT